MAGIGEIFQALFTVLPPEVAGVLLGLVALALVPGWLRSVKAKQIRNRIRRLVRADPDLTKRLHAEILERAGSDVNLLEYAYAEGQKREQVRLLELLQPKLARTAEGRKHLSRHQSKTTREAPPIQHPLETVAVVERMLEQGQLVAARQLLDRALAAHPTDPDLQALAGHPDWVADPALDRPALDAGEAER